MFLRCLRFENVGGLMKSFCGLAKTEESLIHLIKEIFWLNPQYNDVFFFHRLDFNSTKGFSCMKILYIKRESV